MGWVIPISGCAWGCQGVGRWRLSLRFPAGMGQRRHHGGVSSGTVCGNHLCNEDKPQLGN